MSKMIKNNSCTYVDLVEILHNEETFIKVSVRLVDWIKEEIKC